MAYQLQIAMTEQRAPGVEFSAGMATTVLLKWFNPYGPVPLVRADVPDVAEVMGRFVRIPDLIKIDGFWAFCPEVMTLIDRLEPGINQFFPVNLVRQRGSKPLYRQDGAPMTVPYYFLYVTQIIDAVDIERSDVLIRGPSLIRKPGHPFVFRKDLIAGHHIWIGNFHFGRAKICFSDERVSGIRQLGCKGFDAEHFDEV